MQKNILIGAGLLVLCFAAYSNSLGGQFMMDDYGLILNRSAAHDVKHIPLVFRDGDAANTRTLAHYRPVSGVLRVVLFRAFKTNPFAYHLFNVLLFYVYSLLLFFFFRMTGLRETVAVSAVLLFCVHPINAMPVNYITAHEVLLFGIFAVTAMILVLRSGRTGTKVFYYASVPVFSLCLLTQEIAVTLPVFIFLIFYFYRKRGFKKSFLLSLPFVAIVTGYVIFRMGFASIQANIIDQIRMQNLNFFSYAVSIWSLAGWYLAKLFVPVDIALIWNIAPVTDHLIVRGIAGMAVVGLIALLIVRYWRKSERSFWLLLFLAGFMPLSVICFIYPSMGLIIEPHWFFVSSAGFFVLAALWLDSLRRVSPQGWMILLTVVILLLTWQTRRYNAIWKDQKTYCRYWLSLSPANHGPNFWLAHALLQEEDYEQARIYFERALVGGFIDWQVYANLGLMAGAQGRNSEAAGYFQKAMEVNPASGVVYNNLGTMAIEAGDEEQAAGFFEKAIDLDPYLMEPRLNLADLYAKQGHVAEAIGLIEKNLSIDSGERRGQRLLFELYLAAGERQKALQLAQAVLSESRDIPELLTFGGILAQSGLTGAARMFYFKAMEVDARHPDVYVETGKLFGNMGEFETAIALWEDGAKLNLEDRRFPELIDQARRLQQGDPGP